MKIGFDAKRAFHNTTGLGNYSRDLIRIMGNYFPDNSYVLYNTKPKKVNRLTLTSNMKEVLPNTLLWRKLSSLWRQKPILKQLKNDNIEIYHGLSGEIPFGIHKKNIKTVVTIHDLIFVRYPKLYSFFDRKIHFFKFKHAAKKANKIIAISEQTKNDIIDYLKIDKEKIAVVYQGCHAVFKEESTIEERKKLIQKYNLPKDFILNVGTIEERKNALTIVKSIRKVDTDLVIVGRKTAYFNKIKEYIDENDLNDRVHFLGGVSLKELSILYQTAKIFVYPSIFEGFGIPIIEALYSKTPVITTKGGVFPEAAGPASFYIEPFDDEGLGHKIRELLENNELREETIRKGYTFVQKFNDKLIAENLNAIYKSVLND